MSARFIAGAVWPQLTKAVRASRQRCAVAVAYFGKGASRLLPLPEGSRLVVDASEGAVKSGQTCPADLLAMIKRGVRVYSVANLHAKVFVLGRFAFVGSANASNRSAGLLIEAAVCITETAAVKAAREFVAAHCLYEQTPDQLKELAKLYRPPRVPGGGDRRKRGKVAVSSRPELPRVFLTQLYLDDLSEREQSLHDAGLSVAKRKREHPRSFELDSFICTGKYPYRRGDVIIQVTDEGRGNVLVAPPGNVLHVRTGRDGKATKTSVFVERPARRRREVKALARSLGRGALQQLRRDAWVRDADFARKLLKHWSE